MKYLSGGTTHCGALILKTMKTKVTPTISAPALRPWGEVSLVYYTGCASGEQRSGNCKVYTNTAEWEVIWASAGKNSDLYVGECVKVKERSREQEGHITFANNSSVFASVEYKIILTVFSSEIKRNNKLSMWNTFLLYAND